MHNSSLAAHVKSGAMIRSLRVTHGVIKFCGDALHLFFLLIKTGWEMEKKTLICLYAVVQFSTSLTGKCQIQLRLKRKEIQETQQKMRNNVPTRFPRLRFSIFVRCIVKFTERAATHLLHFSRVVWYASATTSKPPLSCSWKRAPVLLAKWRFSRCCECNSNWSDSLR